MSRSVDIVMNKSIDSQIPTHYFRAVKHGEKPATSGSKPKVSEVAPIIVLPASEVEL